MIRISVQPVPLDVAGSLALLERAGVGGIASFTGLVRADDGVEQLELEHYPGMTEATLMALAEEASARWALHGAIILHRVGPMVPGDRVVFVGTAAAHRSEALAACAFLIDRLKTDAPFWKREVLSGSARWVAPRDSDDTAAARWGE